MTENSILYPIDEVNGDPFTALDKSLLKKVGTLCRHIIQPNGIFIEFIPGTEKGGDSSATQHSNQQ
jgi:hypothetical protein